MQGLGAIYNRENSPVAWTRASAEYIRACEEISEATAHAIHPALFKFLDENVAE